MLPLNQTHSRALVKLFNCTAGDTLITLGQVLVMLRWGNNQKPRNTYITGAAWAELVGAICDRLAFG